MQNGLNSIKHIPSNVPTDNITIVTNKQKKIKLKIIKRLNASPLGSNYKYTSLKQCKSIVVIEDI